ncbi:alpha/beta hydrolase [Paenibacillus sp. ACRRX]|uniref:alpha/beta fold hydrolase n=1 Tax=unclassified Paenibacillus TaxID=185978 RepID=UPI001EF4E8FA|nr:MULTISPECIES: alpha/beta hydrolase [unclassified Paenibacillus]MCG7406327.1 alpha/beta hydrolase [Paenibacillus sp. ACRRX]MDK8179362.1 alpha/beta hydrolase [Paenibacillus sp. UMB4589-SE434]
MLKSKKVRVGCAILVVGLLGWIYQMIGVWLDFRNVSPAGKLISINGHQMFVSASGQPSAKGTLVLSAGNGTSSPYADFYPITAEMKHYTRVVTYERPGYGWSEATDISRDIDTMTNEMRQLLQQSGEHPPYIILGHSMGALEGIRFAQMYPEEVSGLIMLDGISPEFARDADMDWGYKMGWYMIEGAKKLGVLRGLSDLGIMTHSFNDMEDLPESIEKLKVSMILKNANNRMMLEERKQFHQSGLKLLEKGKVGDIPVLILSAPNNGYPNWREVQRQLMSISSKATQKSYIRAGHYIHHDYPQDVNNRILKFITSIPPQENSTKKAD